VLLPEGTRELEHADTLTRLAALWEGGKAIFVFDPRGTEALNCDRLNENRTNSISGRWFKYAYDTWMLGDNLACMWAYDIVRAIEYLCSRPDVDSNNLKINSEGELSFAGLLAAVANENVNKFHSSTLPNSYLDLLQSGQYDRRILNEWSIVADILAHYDLPALRRAAFYSVDKQVLDKGNL
jgi:hypothetical protein